ncbi:MAG: phosphodiester glycosidase family protein, partial [Bacteroides sp.]
MMKKRLIILLALCLKLFVVDAQTVADSIAIVSAKWEIVQIKDGLVRKHTSIPELYKVTQNINIVEINPKIGYKVGIAVTDPNKTTSETARAKGALAAINGSYFNVKEGYSVCFLKENRNLIDTTTAGEFKLRVTGAMKEHKGKLELIPWNKNIEQKYRSAKGTVLASGPLMLRDGKRCDWGRCTQTFIETKHPRSAVGVTKDGKILFITVDGRFPGKAGGISIPELAHLISVLGGKDALNLDGGGSTTLWSADAPDN